MMTFDRRVLSRNRAPWVVASVVAVVALALVLANAGRPAHGGRPGAAALSPAAADYVPTTEPTQVIDAKTDPDAAAAALNAGCADIAKCTWQTTSVTAGWGPLKVVGDELYNCSTNPADTAYTAVGFSDMRGETTNVSERVSVKLQGGLINLASTSATFTAFTAESQNVSSEVTVTNSVPVLPQWKGFNTSQAKSALVEGNTYVTSGIHLIEVKDVELTMAGFQLKSDRSAQPTMVNANQEPMTAADIANECNKVVGNATAGRPRPPTGRFDLVVCQHGSDGCVTHTVTGPPPPAPLSKGSKADVTLTRDGMVYATGTDNKGRIRLTAHPAIPAGSYSLTIRERLDDTGHTANYNTVVVPIIIN